MSELNITISDGLFLRLQELAEKDKRTLNKEIEYLLEYCVKNEPHLQRFPFIVANSFSTPVDLDEGEPV